MKPSNPTNMNDIADTLIRLWKYDIEVLSHPWMYIPLCMPAAVYIVFFFMKWAVLTAPLWLPPTIILSCLRKN